MQNLLCTLTLTRIFPQFARCWWSQIAASNTLLSETQGLHYLLTLPFNYLWCVFATLCLVYSVMWLYVFSLCHVHHHLWVVLPIHAVIIWFPRETNCLQTFLLGGVLWLAHVSSISSSCYCCFSPDALLLMFDMKRMEKKNKTSLVFFFFLLKCHLGLFRKPWGC